MRLPPLIHHARRTTTSPASAPEVPAAPAVRVVTDSTASLPAADVEPDGAARGPVIVPLRVLAPDGELREGPDITPEQVAARIAAGQRLTTSQPPPEDLAEAYRRLAADGAHAVVSVHLSGEISGTVTAAAHAGQRAMLPVRVVDSRTAAMGLGFAAQVAARCAASGADADHVAATAERVAASSTVLFLVDSLDHLRRGGRLSAGAAALGTALGVRPILTLENGQVTLVQRVRTRAAAMERMLALAAQHAAGLGRAGIAVHHLGAPERAAAAADRMQELTGVPVVVTPVSAVLGAHAGPGSVAVVVADLGGCAH